jgi:hypothetical protein
MGYNSIGDAYICLQIFKATGLWISGDSVTSTISDHTIRVSITADTGTGISGTGVAQMMVNAINASSSISNLYGTESRNAGGQSIGEWKDVRATRQGENVKVTAIDDRPFTMTISGSGVNGTTASGAGLSGVQIDITGTGPHWFNNSNNWLSGSGANTSGTLIFDRGSTDVRYGLTNTVTDMNIERTNDYKGSIGLSQSNTTHINKAYTEYRPRFLDLPQAEVFSTPTCIIGNENAATSPAGFTKLNYGIGTPSGTTVTVYDAPKKSGGYAVEIIGGKKINVTIYKGSLSIGHDQSQVISNVVDVKVLYVSQPTTDAQFRIGKNTVVTGGSGDKWTFTGGQSVIHNVHSATSLDVEGGAVIFAEGTTTIGPLTISKGGNVIVQHAVSFRDVLLYAGGSIQIQPNAGINSNNGRIGFADTTNIQMHAGSSWVDSSHEVNYTSGIDFIGCTPRDVTLIMQNNRRWLITGIS